MKAVNHEKKKSFFDYNIMLPKSFLNENCKNIRKQDETKILRLYFFNAHFKTVSHDYSYVNSKKICWAIFPNLERPQLYPEAYHLLFLAKK